MNSAAAYNGRFGASGAVTRPKVCADWGIIYTWLAQNPKQVLDEDVFLSAHLSLYREPEEYTFSETMAEKKVFEMFCNKADKYGEDTVTYSKIDNYIIKLSELAPIWYELHNSNSKLVNKILTMDSRKEVKIFLSTIINEKTDKQEEFFDKIEKILFRNRVPGIWLMDERTMANWAREIYNEKKAFDDLLDEINELIARPTDNTNIINGFKYLFTYERGAKGFHRWWTLKYFLFEYEDYLKNKAKETNDKVSLCDFSETTIEHIIPQRYADYWQKEVSEIISSLDGTNLTWVLTSDSLLTISGNGKMIDSSYSFYYYKNFVRAVAIEYGVTTIGDTAFYYFSNLTSVTISNTITSIGLGAFANTGLTSVTIPNSVTYLGYSTFYSCVNLQIVNYNAIHCNTHDAALRPVFRGCSAITVFNIGDSVKVIPSWLFTNPAFTSVTIPNSVTTIEDGAFLGCTNLISITIGSNVANIGKQCFSSSPNLNFIRIKALTPPIFGNDAFFNVPDTIPIYIPCGTLGIYSNDSLWIYFSNFIEDCNRIYDVIQNEKTSTYPNPTNDKFFIELDGVASIKLYDLLGKEVLTQTANGKTEIDINHLPKGIYNIQILSESKIIGNSKVVKQ